MSSKKYNRNMELRNLPASALANVAKTLEINRDWQKVVRLIPKTIDDPIFKHKYSAEEIEAMEIGAIKKQQPFAATLFEEWGTSGQVRPTLGFLMSILEKAHIFRAADEIAHMIEELPPRRPPGPAAPVTTNVTDIQTDESMGCNRPTRAVEEPNPEQRDTPINTEPVITEPSNDSEYRPNLTAMINETPSNNSECNSVAESFESGSTDNPTSNTLDSSQSSVSRFMPRITTSSTSAKDIFDIIDKAIIGDEKLMMFAYKELEAITDNFSGTLVVKPNGPVGKIGSGGFGDVFVGIHKDFGPLAIKKVRLLAVQMETVMKIFNTEVKSLSDLRHDNIVPIFGYSIDGPTPCLVCEYIDGGSLEEKIQARVLTEQQRIDILIGTADGLKYIHKSERPPQSDNISSGINSLSSKKSYYLHGDVKSANILLTKGCVPKLCDFGLAKQLETTTYHTKNMGGTCAYMPLESFNGNISQKTDIYSFGIVMLELLTGLKAIFKFGDGSVTVNLYLEENFPNDITNALDSTVPNWTKHQEIYKLANKCSELVYRDRPTIDYVCEALKEINNKKV